MKVDDRTEDRTALWITMAIMCLAVLTVVVSFLALFQQPAKASITRIAAPAPVAYTVTKADLAPLPLAVATSTTARAGEGVIRITTRICGNANAWQAVAASNRIQPPVYLVLLGQTLLVSCSGGSAPAQAPAQVTSGWVAPVNACVSSPYGWRWGRMHWGVDLSAGYGTPIRAVHSGTVRVTYNGGSAGNYTTIVHGGGLASVYMHQSRFAVTSGWVNTGQVIGYVGATGNATRYVNGVLRSFPHLHFETHTAGLWNGKVNPVGFMSARGVRLGC